jgi:methylmalonyl-CoA mutase cobalamin-binding domain/chain
MKKEERLVRAVADLEEEKVLVLARSMLEEGAEPMLLVELCRRGLQEVGERYQRREYYLSALIMSGEIFRQVMELLERSGCFEPPPATGAVKVVLGTPLGDVHDIGKDIVAMLLRCSGYEVVDLGVNVPPRRFRQALEESEARVLGMSVLITVAYEPILETVRELERCGLREGIMVMLGGGAASGRLCEYAGADAWSNDAMDALRFLEESGIKQRGT